MTNPKVTETTLWRRWETRTGHAMRNIAEVALSSIRQGTRLLAMVMCAWLQIADKAGAASTVDVTFHGTAMVNGGFVCEIDGKVANGYCYDPMTEEGKCYQSCQTESKTVTLEINKVYNGSMYKTTSPCLNNPTPSVDDIPCYSVIVGSGGAAGTFTVTVTNTGPKLTVSPESLPPDGESTAFASLGLGFTPPVNFDFVEPSDDPGLGCKLQSVDTNGGTAIIVAGTNIGTVKIRATDANNCKYDATFDLVPCGGNCQGTCPIGDEDIQDSSVSASFRLGRANRDSSAGSFSIKSSVPDYALYLPAKHRYHFIRNPVQIQNLPNGWEYASSRPLKEPQTFQPRPPPTAM